MKKELYGICREVGETNDREIIRIYQSNFLIDILLKWRELSEENDLLDGSWMITVYRSDPSDPIAQYARFDFVATDLHNYDDKK